MPALFQIYLMNTTRKKKTKKKKNDGPEYQSRNLVAIWKTRVHTQPNVPNLSHSANHRKKEMGNRIFATGQSILFSDPTVPTTCPRALNSKSLSEPATPAFASGSILDLC